MGGMAAWRTRPSARLRRTTPKSTRVAHRRREAKTKIWFGTHGAQEFETRLHARRFGGRKSGRPPQRHLRDMLLKLRRRGGLGERPRTLRHCRTQGSARRILRRSPMPRTGHRRVEGNGTTTLYSTIGPPVVLAAPTVVLSCRGAPVVLAVAHTHLTLPTNYSV